MNKTHEAFVVRGREVSRFYPTLQKGDPQTQKFAAASSDAANVGGVSMVISDDVSEITLRSAMTQIIETYKGRFER